ncbi:CpsD/CapB family tyrosine-protein kinase [Bacillus carboniphilus]|uniref:non-specific protein-tyrosine kinase n=1 Tax=Bacillus carboniphilus TaxID=86663 RepID=A0ABY9JWI2_9BACI|nr:CpsD/CapB family tyrosine-protein kinase [Bacillus carboniphilus]WLR42780.1 CpsD/CapB family tyrosine-protein kinase [Bacillus carboniphilus]
MIRMLKRKSNKHKTKNIITQSIPESLVSEQFRKLRTNFYFMVKDFQNPTLLFTSSKQKEGKSSTLANLAYSLVNDREKVVIIDANLRNPSQHLFFKLPNTVGLSSILSSKRTLEETVSYTGISNLYVLTSGPSLLNPAELLGLDSMNYLIEEAKSKFDYVLIDSPSILEATDSNILASLCDGVILVIHSKANQHEVLESKRILTFGHARFLGAIMNEM